MSEKKRNTLYWLFKIAGIFISCLLPIWSICEKYPVWTVTHGKIHSLGTGGILIAIVLIVIFRRTVFDFLRDRFNLRHAPPLLVWPSLLVTSYALMYISKFLYDMNTIFWMGFIGCAIGTFLTFIAENRFGKDRDKNGGV